MAYIGLYNNARGLFGKSVESERMAIPQQPGTLKNTNKNKKARNWLVPGL